MLWCCTIFGKWNAQGWVFKYTTYIQLLGLDWVENLSIEALGWFLTHPPMYTVQALGWPNWVKGCCCAPRRFDCHHTGLSYYISYHRYLYIFCYFHFWSTSVNIKVPVAGITFIHQPKLVQDQDDLFHLFQVEEVEVCSETGSQSLVMR